VTLFPKVLPDHLSVAFRRMVDSGELDAGYGASRVWRRRDIRTRPRIWWPAMSLGPWPAGQCSVCGVPCHQGTQYFFQFEEGLERHCRFCHDWTRKMLRA
jgi:hypothetical protein